jgi:hypothetical protein
MEFVATCLFGLEKLLGEEIDALATDVATRLAEDMEKAAARPTYGAYYASGAHHDDKRRQLLLGEESEKGDSIKRLSK